MTIHYRADDPVSGRWLGNTGGNDMSALQIDENFYQVVTRVATLEANMAFTVGIAYITLSGTEFTFHMTDHTLQGPFSIPPFTFTDRGVWAASTAYSVNDTFSINGTLYLVIFGHISGLVFDAGANDGLGHNYYSPMLTIPGNSLPTGGAAGMMLYKVDGHDFHVSWKYPVPVGGLTGYVLTKVSGGDFDMTWSATATLGFVSAPPPSPAGAAGDLLSTLDGTAGSMQWITVAIAADFLDNTSGKVLTTTSVWDAADFVTLTDAATIVVNMSTFINASVTVTGNRLIGNPTGSKNGQTGVIEVVQDGTGSRAPTFGSNWKTPGAASPVWSTAPGAVDWVFYEVRSPTFIYYTIANGIA